MARCTAKTRKGTRCKRHAVKGKKVCQSHGGAKGAGRPVQHGMRSMRVARMARLGHERLSAITNDPGLTDVRRTVAVNEYLLEQTFLADVTEDEVWAFAQRWLGREPEESELPEARMELARRRGKTLEQHARMQEMAHRQLTKAEIMFQVCLPVLNGHGRRVQALVDRLLTRHQLPASAGEAFRDDLRRLMLSAVGELEQVTEQAR